MYAADDRFLQVDTYGGKIHFSNISWKNAKFEEKMCKVKNPKLQLPNSYKLRFFSNFMFQDYWLFFLKRWLVKFFKSYKILPYKIKKYLTDQQNDIFLFEALTNYKSFLKILIPLLFDVKEFSTKIDDSKRRTKDRLDKK